MWNNQWKYWLDKKELQENKDLAWKLNWAFDQYMGKFEVEYS